jgi:protocatechuate 4,5-dioxygenase alpha chain
VQLRQLAVPVLDLSEPGTIEFTAERALAGRALNRFALSLRSPASRTQFLADDTGYMRRFGLSGEHIRLVRAQDWTGLLLAGCHLQAALKLAATVGADLWTIGAHNAGCSREELLAAVPRRVTGLPATPASASAPAPAPASAPPPAATANGG